MKDKNNKVVIPLILGIMCFFLTAGIFIQIKTVANSSTTVGKTQVENELRDSLLRWKEKYENASNNLSNKEEELEKMRENVSDSTSASSGLNDKLTEYNTLLGYTELKGKGIIITLTDGDPLKIKGDPSSYIVHDIDLVQTVNALKNTGAEAISINGERITSRTSITCIGNVVKINDQKIGSPFVIKAIGEPNKLYGQLTMPGGYLQYIKSLGVQVNVEQVDKETIIIPKYNGIYSSEYIKTVE